MKRVLLLLLALLMPVTTGFATDYCDCPSAEAHAERQQAFDRVLYGHNAMGASIALIKDGKIIDTFQYGRSNRADNTPVDSDTLFRCASVTKMVSAVGVLQLVEKGLIDLDGDLGETFGFSIRNPYHPDTLVTLRQVMSHTATLSDQYHYDRAVKGDITSLKHVFDGNYTQMNYFRQEPGTMVKYSNFGGGLLGAVIEELSGCTVDEYMIRNVFAPLDVLGAYHTPCLPDGTQIARIYNPASTGMTLDPMSFEDEHWDPEPEFAYVHTAGALCITAEGLAKVIIALAGDGSVDGVQLLQPETVAAMRTNQNNIGSVKCDASRGLNLNIIENALVQGRTLYGHQGKAYGMICAAYFDPIDQTGVVLLTNGCDTATVNSVAKIARAILTQAYQYL